ncbi:hypothetical protein ACQPZX_03060 [Actinoplanes sp. CA-142083]|uniref:hypothetical protein n=1 Tax=Actinoplanes sp. CA-142083 TaxID=3239903 RepID=UPI003D8AE881
MSIPAVGRVARAGIAEPQGLALFGLPNGSPTLSIRPADSLRSALQAGYPLERYRRLWRFGRTRELDGCIRGHLGYEREKNATLWDRTKQDFAKAPVPNGSAAPFMIRLSDLTVVFQPKPDLRLDSFIGALQAMIRTQTRETGWRVASLTGEVSFDEWRSRVDLVTRIRFRMRKSGSRQTQSRLIALLTEPGSDLATVELRAAEGLETSAPLVVELANLAESGYGEFAAKGVTGDASGTTREWTSTLRGESIMTEVELEPETGEAPWNALDEQLAGISSAPPSDAA